MNFISNGIAYDGITFSTGLMELGYMSGGDLLNATFVYIGFADGWRDTYGNNTEAYRTVTFDNQEVSDEFYEWFMANTTEVQV